MRLGAALQTVYLACKKDAQTMRVGAAAREAFGVTTGPYMPHLSLLYDAGISNEEVGGAATARGKGKHACSWARGNVP
eukprot:54440-Chlamydomonas_euryale.AAC.2